MLLFPGINVELGELRIITLSEKTENDMTGWSQSVEEEREELLGHVSIIIILKRLIPRLLRLLIICMVSSSPCSLIPRFVCV